MDKYNIFLGVVKFELGLKDIEDWEFLIDNEDGNYNIYKGKGLNNLYTTIRDKVSLYGITQIYTNDIKALFLYSKEQHVFKWSENSKPIANSMDSFDFLTLVDEEIKIEFRSWKRFDEKINDVEEFYRAYWTAYNYLGTRPGPVLSGTIFHGRVMYRSDGHCFNFKKSMAPVNLAALPKTEEELDFYLKYFRGGMCYVNPFYVNQTFESIGSADKKTCHLGSMVSRKYPLKGFINVNPEYFDYVESDSENTAFIATICFKNLRHKNSSLLPDLAYNFGKPIVRNSEPTGEWVIKINDADWEWFKENYSWEDAKVDKLLVGEKVYLPKDCIKYFIKLFNEKDLEEKETIQRKLAKGQTEYLYGNSIKRLYYEFEAELEEGEVKISSVGNLSFEDKIEILKKRPLPLQLGIWTVAYSRRDIWRAIQIVGPDKSGYGDTDSTKGMFGPEMIPALNIEINREFKKAEDYLGFKLPEQLGRWCYEYTADKFKVVSRKWYIYMIGKEIHFRAAGAQLDVLEKWVEEHRETIFEDFSTTMKVEGLFKIPKYDFKKGEVKVKDLDYFTDAYIIENSMYTDRED